MNRETYEQNFWREIKQAGEELRRQDLPKLRKEDFFLFEKTGNRLVYEQAYFGRRKFLTVFGILAEFGGKKEDIEKLEEVMQAVCEERFWALPAHVNFKALDEKTIDLFAAETAQTLSELLYILGDQLSEETIERVEKEIVERVLEPFCRSAVPYSWWEKDKCNWSAVCAGSVGMTAIYMDRIRQNKWQSAFNDTSKKERNQQYVTKLLQGLSASWKEDCMKRVCDALACYLEGMEEDGACTEGLGYYSYGMSYYTGFAELYEQEQSSLMRGKKCRNIALFQQKCYFGKGVSISFSDGSDKEYFLPGLTAYLKYCYPEVEIPDFQLARPFEEDSCYRWLTNERNIRWLRQYAGNEEAVQEQKQEQQDSYEFLPSAQWMICKDKLGNGYAAKGGHNAENHNHNDVGHFLCVYEGEMLLTDLGAGEYTKDYFSAGRYDILCNRSLGHSLPIICGQEQREGREYAADSFFWDDSKKSLEISFAGAYEKGLLEQLVRTITMQSDNGLSLLVEDRFLGVSLTGSIKENLITTYPTEIIGKRSVQIAGEHSKCTIEIALSSSDDDEKLVDIQLAVIPKEHSCHDGSKKTVYLIQWNVPIFSKNEIKCKMKIHCV